MDVSPDQCAVLATTAPILLFVLVAERGLHEGSGIDGFLVKCLAALLVAGNAWVTWTCVRNLDQGITGHIHAYLVWTAISSSLGALVGYHVVRIVMHPGIPMRRSQRN